MRTEYYIDHIALSSYGITVLQSRGLFDAPTRKVAYRHQWSDSPGEDVDLTTAAMEPRVFELDCLISASNISTAWFNLKSFMDDMDETGYHVLTLQYMGKEYEYDIYRQNGVKISKRFMYGKNVWTFTLILNEYIPAWAI